MKFIHFFVNLVYVALVFAGAYFSIRYNSGWWFFVGFIAAWLAHLVLGHFLRKITETSESMGLD